MWREVAAHVKDENRMKKKLQVNALRWYWDLRSSGGVHEDCEKKEHRPERIGYEVGDKPGPCLTYHFKPLDLQPPPY